MGMNTRTLLTVLAVVAVAFAATNCLAATVDANKPCDINKPAEPNKVTIISASDFGTYAAEANKPAEKGKGHHHHKKDPNSVEPKPAEPNKAAIISASDFGTYAKDANKPADVNKPAEPNKTKLAEEGEKGKGHHHKKDPNDPNSKPAEPNKATIISASDFGTFAADANKPAEKGKGHRNRRDPNSVEPNKPAEPNKSKLCAIEAGKRAATKTRTNQQTLTTRNNFTIFRHHYVMRRS